MIVIAGTLRVEPQRRGDAVVAAAAMMKETQKEEGCLAYAFSADLADENLIHVFERWESQEALDAHFKTPHMAEFQQQAGGLGLSGMDFAKYQIESVGPVF